jgi:NDP-sugar pyrophosphorylase family protein
LRPLTDRLPKPMIEIAGRPIIEHNLERLARFGVRDVWINLHHEGDAIRKYLGDGSAYGVHITYVEERELRGTAGALNVLRGKLDATFLVVFGDNLSTCRLDRLVGEHQRHRAVATVAAFQRPDAAQSGMLVMDDGGAVARFVEKPQSGEIVSNWVNAGIIAFEPRALDYVPQDRPSDLGRDVLPAMIAAGESVRAYQMTERLWWIDTPADYERTTREVTAEMLSGD